MESWGEEYPGGGLCEGLSPLESSSNGRKREEMGREERNREINVRPPVKKKKQILK